MLLACTFISNLFFSILIHGLVNVNSSVLPEVRKYGRRTRSSTSNVNKYIIKKCKTTTYQKSFVIRTSGIWNCPVDGLDLISSTLASFKSVIFEEIRFVQVYLFKMQQCSSLVSSNNLFYVAVVFLYRCVCVFYIYFLFLFYLLIYFF